jgi:hypothetical protein
MLGHPCKEVDGGESKREHRSDGAPRRRAYERQLKRLGWLTALAFAKGFGFGNIFHKSWHRPARLEPHSDEPTML